MLSLIASKAHGGKSSRGLELLYLYGFASYNLCDFYLGLSLLMVCSFLQQMFRVPGIPNFLECPLNLWVYSHSFMHCSLRGSLLDLPLKSGSLLNPTIVSLCKTVLRSSVSVNNSQVSWHPGCSGFCVPGWLSIMK